jgi:hypothetical protein
MKNDLQKVQELVGKITIPKEVLLDKKLCATEKLLYGILESLINDEENSSRIKSRDVTNRLLGLLIGITPTRISECLRKLTAHKYITMTYTIHPFTGFQKQRNINVNRSS